MQSERLRQWKLSRAIVGAFALSAAGAATVALWRRGSAWPPSIQSAEFFPSLVAGGLGVMGVLLLAQTAVPAIRGAALAPHPDDPAESETSAAQGDAGAVEAPWRLAAVMFGVLAFHAAIAPVGMVMASVAAIAVLAPVLGYRRWGVVFLVALVLPAAVWLLFRRTLQVLLPTGSLWE